MELLYYDLGKDVEAFSTRRDSVLPYHVIQAHQIHGDRIAVIDNPNTTREDLEGIDALITNLPNCPIAVRSADCVPILLYDPVQRAIAAVHSGWRGTSLKIVQKTLSALGEYYGVKPSDVKAIIGPSIGPDSFKVHNDVINSFIEAGFPLERISRQVSSREYLVNLWEANKWLLIEAGVHNENIYVSGICSFINHDEFYSARYEGNNKCGRTINSIKCE